VTAGIGAALLAHKRYGIDRTDRVDVFSVLRRAGAEVFFRPLYKICGAYLPSQGHSAGVLINSNLPLSRQRYTAAHEFGHIFLNHAAISVDETTGGSLEERRHWSDEESIADAFAAFFLMPPPLVDRSLADLGVTTLSAETVYLLSLKMGTSYQATVNHLQTLRKLSSVQAATFLRVRPKQIKTRITESVASRHDVWTLDEHWNGQRAYPAIEDTIVVRLPETPTSGYAWVWRRNPEILRMVRDGFADEPRADVGGGRVRELVLEVSSDEHPEKIDLERRQPWDPDGQPTARFSVDLFPQPLRTTGPLVLPTLQ
jgi:Zn-dependent peptidase ImmA (M78 family)/predicted secreted protein